ncbi:Hsp20/alpha crystallin family protein [Flagellimonas okinawensis]|uniref:Hsp20/alpha crystallin family protein n=1 Tax=Flagellimonas okinawensis TaxID=3031324 RepID=A0ABT5XP60_9FLAO|nr:Hsp20/alpha crystallin family protein [[Muricauda] okinawensis]MDF0707684.1 Hsp20/alpha crystallin family protein [[Muricauda] okinawensis]
MKVFGKEVGTAIQFPPILKRLKKWTEHALGMDKPRSLAMPSTGSTISETDFGLSIAMPGFDKINVKMELRGYTLIISGKKKESREVKEGHSVHREFVRPTFRKTLDLPRDVDPESIHATLKNGLLQVRFSKRETMYKRVLRVA